ncbi:stealth family protein [Nocardiopsis ganjiahuensis]|uniref:stealth family protein n=1 Tax=Nocardiopsis ganjiahuensis TaxID=239984 RepID=UPI00034B4603|nr:stealth family protein [Nocardiopsis ganjiahuensis]
MANTPIPLKIAYRRVLKALRPGRYRGLSVAVHRNGAVLARKWEGAFTVTEFAALQLERCTSLLSAHDIPCFLVRNSRNYQHAIAVDVAHRPAVLELLAREFTGSGMYVSRPDRGARPVSSWALRALRRTPYLRLGEYVTGGGRSVVAGFEHGCVIEFWQEGAEVLAQEDGGAETLENLKVVAPESVLQGALVAPRPNPVGEIVPEAERTPAEAEVNGRRYPTLEVFARTLTTDITFPVDAVYTWVDGNDPRWRANRNSYLEEAGALNPDAASNSRYANRNELLYSLRSLEMYAPFIRKVYIVTDGQVPAWLDTGQERIQVVDHKEIFDDPGLLPVFNSHAIESQLHHIDGLSEHYLYLNDDVAFGRPVTAEHFFHPNGIVKLNPSPYRFGLGEATVEDQPVDAAAKMNNTLIQSLFGRTAVSKFKHTPIPQRRSVLRELEERFPEVFARTAASRFRSPDDHSIPSSLHHHYSLLTGRAVHSRLSYAYLNLADPEAFRERSREMLNDRRFEAFCVNDTTESEDPGADGYLEDFLSRYLPLRGSFEVRASGARPYPAGT